MSKQGGYPRKRPALCSGAVAKHGPGHRVIGPSPRGEATPVKGKSATPSSGIPFNVN